MCDIYNLKYKSLQTYDELVGVENWIVTKIVKNKVEVFCMRVGVYQECYYQEGITILLRLRDGSIKERFNDDIILSLT